MGNKIVNAGYEIISMEAGIAIGHHEAAPAKWVTWEYSELDDGTDFFFGHYFAEEIDARRDYHERIMERYGRTKVSSYPDYVMQAVRQNLGRKPNDKSSDEIIMGMEPDSVLDMALSWEGICGYGYFVKKLVQDIYRVNLS